MAQENRTELKARLDTGDTIDQTATHNLLDSVFVLNTDTTDNLTEGATKLFYNTDTSTSNTVSFANQFTYHSAAGGGGLSGDVIIDLTSAKAGATAIFRSNNGTVPAVSVTGGTLRAQTDLTTNYVVSTNNELWFYSGVDANGDKFVFLTIKPATLTDYDTFYVGAGAMVASITNGSDTLTEETASNEVTLDYFEHSVSAEKSTNFEFPLPAKYDSAGLLKAKIIYDAAATSTGDVTFGISLKGIKDNTSFASAFGTEVTITDTFGTVGTANYTAATGTITPSNTPEANEIVLAKVVVKTTSTLTPGPVKIKGVLFQYRKLNTILSAW